ncbi:flagellar hook-length control protein [Litchfieldella qijiaojingensis]|uniref:Flagellar hook-length control protein n=1 Tax=Litchfieldella qijiaojingensis TaxID=980347 RepID=A0ABQ2YBP5_9GAMM|nr:flagellar hook-length control protein FliK [Halomonas qijiaojingensis]GGX78089.1 flagellar hook-length control protein [Halomonas qijiaojingensis]
MDIHALLTPTGKAAATPSNGVKQTDVPPEGAFSSHFDQASAQTSTIPVDTPRDTSGKSALATLDSQKTQGQEQTDTSPTASLAPLPQGIAQASGMSGQASEMRRLLEEVIVTDSASSEALPADALLATDIAPGEQDPLATIRERLALIDQAGQLRGEVSPATTEIATGNVTEAVTGTGAEHVQPGPERAQSIMNAGLQAQQVSSARPLLAEPAANRQSAHAAPDVGPAQTQLAPALPQSASDDIHRRMASGLQTLDGQSATAATQTTTTQGNQPPSLPPQIETVMRDGGFSGQPGQGNENSVRGGMDMHHVIGTSGQGQTGAVSGGAASAPAQATNPMLASTLPAHVSSPQWSQQLGQQLVGLHQRGGQRVELHLNPAELGPLSVSLKVNEHGAQAQFLSAHAQVRTAIEQAIPQLREALEEQGISLGETMVGEHPQQQPQEQPAFAGNSNSMVAGADDVIASEDQDGVTIPLAHDGSNGRVDLYA